MLDGSPIAMIGGRVRKVGGPYAMPADGKDETSARDAAIAAAQAALTEAQTRAGAAREALAILGPLAARLRRALAHIRRVPEDLGEFYEHWYEHARLGRRAPDDSQFFTGEAVR